MQGVLDIETLRLVQAAVGLCVFVLVFFGTFRATKAKFAGWWAALVAGSALGTASYELITPIWPHVAAVVGNTISVAAMTCAWVAAREVRGVRHVPYAYAVPAAVTLIWTSIDNPAPGELAGRLSLMLTMAWGSALAARELWLLIQERNSRTSPYEVQEASVSVLAMMTTSLVIASFYLVRASAYVTLGPNHPWVSTWLGPPVTTLIVTIALVVVTYSVGQLSHVEIARKWQRRAIRDDLTGMLLRQGFRTSVAKRMEHEPQVKRFLVVADIDHFKQVNDLRGHHAGDMVLESFARSVQSRLGHADVAARFGGEEFVFLVEVERSAHVKGLLDRIDQEFASLGQDHEWWPTVSYGVAALSESDIDAALRHADAALYRAKRSGRSRTEFAL